MPFYLKEINTLPCEFAGFNSVLIVPCRFCPAASLAVRRNEPYIEFFRRFMKTASYEQMINTLQANLEDQGIRTGVYGSNLLHQFFLCAWTTKKRDQLLAQASHYEALLVLGCEAAARTIKDAVKSTSCHVIQGMKTEGLMSVRPKFQLPCTISLQLDSVTPIQK